MPQNISSEMHQISEVICNRPKWSGDSKAAFLASRGEQDGNRGFQAALHSPACQMSH